MEWIEYDDIWQKFADDGLGMTGVLLEVETPDGSEYVLLGDLNNVGGSCDHCTGISNSDVIKRYSVGIMNLLDHAKNELKTKIEITSLDMPF